MKKLILILLASVAINGRLHAEGPVDLGDQIVLGIKAGTNYSNVYDSRGDAFVANPKYGFAAGGFVSIPFLKIFGIQPEILYSQKGFHGTGQLLGSEYNFTRTTSFIDVPVFFAFKPVPFVTFLAGPQYSYLLRQKDVFGSGPNSYSQEQEFKNENIRKNILSVAIGADINIEHIVLGIRAAWDVQNNNGDGTSTIPRYKNVWYQATVGYRLF